MSEHNKGTAKKTRFGGFRAVYTKSHTYDLLVPRIFIGNEVILELIFDE